MALRSLNSISRGSFTRPPITRCSLLIIVLICGLRSRSGVVLQRFPAGDEDTAALDLHRNGRHAAIILAQRLAGDEREAPVVQRAGHAGVVDDALAERRSEERR